MQIAHNPEVQLLGIPEQNDGIPAKKAKNTERTEETSKITKIWPKSCINTFDSDEDDEDDGSEVSNDSHNSNITKSSEENSFQEQQEEESPKFKDDKSKNREEKFPETRPILKAMTLRPMTTNAISQQVLECESKSSLNLPNNEFIERKPEVNQPKFFGDGIPGSPKSKTQMVNFAPSRDFSYESLSALSNFSKKSNVQTNSKNKKKNMRTVKGELEKKISGSSENAEDSHSHKRRSISKEGSGSGTFDDSKKSSNSEKNSSPVAGLLKKTEEQRETQIFTTLTEKEVNIDDACKSFDNYFVYNNVEKVVEKMNEINDRRRKRRNSAKRHRNSTSLTKHRKC